MAAPYMVQTSLSFMAITALAEIHRVFNRAELSKQDPTIPIVKEIMRARGKHIVLHGLGREGLIMRAFAMRLFHLGLPSVHFFGDMCTPMLATGDLLIVSSGPGWFSSADAIIVEATASGARVLVITSKPDGEAAKLATTIALVPAQTMADPDFDPNAPPDAPPQEAVQMVDSKTPWQLEHANQQPGKVPKGDPMAADPPKGTSKGPTKKGEVPPATKTSDAKKASIPDTKTGGSIANADAKKGSTKQVEGEVTTTPRLSKAGSKVLNSPAMPANLQEATRELCKAGITLYPPEKARFVVTDNKILPMGSCYEGALFILFEIVVYTLREKLQEVLPVMRGRNTNLDHFPPTHSCGPPPPPPPPPPPGECGKVHPNP
jgi:6-phospho-3-hexuloisomerase